MAVEYETLVQGGYSKFAEEIFKKVKDKTLIDEVKGSDSVPYHFRQTPYGDRLKEKIVGGTVAFNQLFPITARTTPYNLECVTANGITTITGTYSGSENAAWRITGKNDTKIPSGHKVFICGADYTKFKMRLQDYNSFTERDTIISTTNEITADVVLSAKFGSGTVLNSTMKFQIFDLTAMFGTETADRLYTLEQTTAGAGVALFRKLFPKLYYPYNPGELISVSGLQSHDEVGFNQWDGVWEYGYIYNGTLYDSTTDYWRSKNYIKVIPNVSYYFKVETGGQIACFDKNKQYISSFASFNPPSMIVEMPSGCEYIKFYQGKSCDPNTVCINLSDPSRNGQYEPYKKHSYALDSSLTLRGLFKLDANNQLYADGDWYESAGKHTERFKQITLNGSETWTFSYDAKFYTAVHDMKKRGNYLNAIKADKLATVQDSFSYLSGVTAITGYYDVNNNYPNQNWIYVRISDSITSVDELKSWLANNPITVVYELATPIVTEAEPYQSPQRCAEGGTEEYVTTGIVPVGHESEYVSNKAERFDALPDAAQEDGDYVIRQKNGVMELVDAEESSKLVESESGNPITIVTDSAQMAKSTKITFEPIQDLHGYDHPWSAGGGKNLIPLTESAIKSISGVTWTGDSVVLNGVTFTIQKDNGGNVTGISANGTPSSGNVQLTIARVNITEGSYTFSGITGGSLNSFYVRYVVRDSSGKAISIDESVFIDVYSVETTKTIPSNASYVNAYLGVGAAVSNKVFTPMIRLSSVTDATFAPYSNICPISGWTGAEVSRTGKNLFDVANKKTFGGYVNTSTQKYESNNSYASVYIECKPNTTYTISKTAGHTFRIATSEQKPANGVLYLYTNANHTGSTITVTTGSNAKFLLVNYWYSGAGDTITADEFANSIQIEVGSTSTAYVPYAGEEYQITFPSEAGTIYGGTLDLETGELVVDMGIADMGNLSWTAVEGQSLRFASYISTLLPSTSRTLKVLSSCYKSNVGGGAYDEGTIYNASTDIYVVDTRYTTASDFATAVNGQTIAYPLATPITCQLTPQQLALFKGINNISTNAKTVKVTFRNGKLALMDDIPQQLAIEEKKTDEKISTSIFPILGNFATAETSPASASHAVGEYLLYNNRLYKVLASISAGQQLTIGTNVGQTNVAAELASQASEISALNSKTSIEALNISIESGITNNLFVRKQSGIVTINGYLESSTAFGSNVKVANVPAGSRPFVAVRSMCALANAAYDPPGSIGYVCVSDSGNIYVTAPSNNTYKVIYFSLSYMAQA